MDAFYARACGRWVGRLLCLWRCRILFSLSLSPAVWYEQALQCPRLEEVALAAAHQLHTLAANHCPRLRTVLPLGPGRGGGGGGAAGRGLELLRAAEFVNAKVSRSPPNHSTAWARLLGGRVSGDLLSPC